MPQEIVGINRWSLITKLIYNQPFQGWVVTAQSGTYADSITITAPCGTSTDIIAGSSAQIAGVNVFYYGLYADPVWPCPGGKLPLPPPPPGVGCSQEQYYKLNIPAGSCNIYRDVPPAPVYNTNPTKPPMKIVTETGLCFNYFVENNMQWYGQKIFTGEDFFGKPKIP
jgi:hypothetical protein